MYMKNEPGLVQNESSKDIIIHVEPANGISDKDHQGIPIPNDTEVQIMKYILSKNASYSHESTSVYNKTVLHAAARIGNVKFLTVLYDWIKSHAQNEAEAIEQFLSIMNKGNRNAILQACRSGEKNFLECVERLIPREQFFNLLKITDTINSENCLHLACTKGNETLIRKLVAYDIGAELIEEQNKLNRYPIDNFLETMNKSEADKPNTLSLIELICPNKMLDDNNSVFPKCLEICIDINYVKIFETIIKKVHDSTKMSMDSIYMKLLTLTNEKRQNVFHFFSQENTLEVLRVVEKNVLNKNDQLMNLYKQDLVTPDIFGKKPMDYSFFYENDNMTKVLFDNVQRHIDLTVGLLKNPIYSSIEKDSRDSLKLILSNAKLKEKILFFELNKESKNSDSSTNNTLLHLCAEFNSIKCLDLIIEEFNHAQIFECMQKKNADDWIPINKAIDKKNIKIIERFLQFCENNSFNIHKVLEIADEDSNRSLHFAAECGNAAILSLILNCYPRTSAKNVSGKSFLDILCTKGYLSSLKQSTEFMKANNQEIRLENAIRCAIENLHADVVEYLLKNDDKNALVRLIKSQYKVEDGNIITNDDDDSDEKIKDLTVLYDESLINLLDLAIKSNDEESAKVIVDNATISELEALLISVKVVKGSKILTFWDLIDKMPVVAEMCLDRFLDVNDEKEKYELDFILLDRKYLLSKYPDLKKKLPTEKTLNVMADAESEALLKHPFVGIYLNLKWNFLTILFYYGGLLLYLLMAILLSVILIDNRDTKFENNAMTIIVFLISLFLLFKEGYQLVTQRIAYFAFDNVIELTSFISSIVMTVPSGDANSLTPADRFQSGCVAVIFTFIALGFYTKRLARIGIYSSAVMQVLKTIVIFLMTMSVYIIGFSIVFYVLFNIEGDAMDYKWAWIVRTAMMMIGEVGYDDIVAKSTYEIKYFVFSLFLIALPIVINNLLISFSISDTKEILDNATIQTLKTEVSFLTALEFTMISKVSVYLNEPNSNLFWSNIKFFNDFLSGRSNVNIIQNSKYQDTAIYKWRAERKGKQGDDGDSEDGGALRAKISEMDRKFEALSGDMSDIKSSIMKILNKLK